MYRHVRLARGIRADEVHAFLENHDDVWELTLVTLDKPFLFSNIAGVLSYFGMDIHRGQAMTTPDGLVLDVFEFSDEEGFLRQNAGATAGDLPHARARGRRLRSTCRRCCAAASRSVLYRRRQRGAAASALRQRTLAASTPCSRSSPTMPRACFTASAA